MLAVRRRDHRPFSAYKRPPRPVPRLFSKSRERSSTGAPGEAGSQPRPSSLLTDRDLQSGPLNEERKITMSCNTAFILPWKFLQLEPSFCAVRRVRPSLLGLLVLMMAASLPAWGAGSATTTTLTTGSKTVNARTITTLTANVTATGTTTVVTVGQVRFYDGKVLLGMSQIVQIGTKFTHGSAYLSVELGPGAHSLTAVYAGKAGWAGSTSAAATVTIAGGATSTTISSTGAAGAYTLTGQVIANGAAAVTGNVNFIDQTAGNVTLGTAALGAATPKRTYAAFSALPLYTPDPAGDDFPQQAVLADLNGDGILDIVDLDYSAKLSVHLGKGDGTFLAAQSYCMDSSQTPTVPCDGGYEPTSIAIGDFNSDGIPDLVFASPSYVQVALGKGDGTFQLPVQYLTQGNNTQVLTADLNRDGALDLVVSIDNGVSILLGNGNGTFQPHSDVSLSTASTYITIGDFNKDGIPDIASAGWNGSDLMVLLGNGNGTFQAEKDTPIDINTAGCTVAAADFKNTGYLADMAICGGNGVAEALVGKGDGTFAAPQTLYANGSFFEYVNWFTPVDLNGDGNVDLVMTWDSSDTDVGRIAVFTGTGTGTFNATPTTITTGKKPVFVAAADLNGNGALDLVTANDTDNNLSVISQSATSTATATLANVSLPGTGNQSVVAQYAGNSGYAASTSAAITLTGSGAVTGPPTIASLTPASVASGSGAFTLTVNGTNFSAGAVVTFAGSARTTTFVSTTKLTAAISAIDVAAAGTFGVMVTVGTQVSNGITFNVNQSSTGPTIMTLSPNYAAINSPATTITITGTNFVSGSSAIHFGTTALATTFVSATKLSAAIPAANLTTLGTFSITVWNGAASSSNSVTFTVGPVTHLPLAYGFFSNTGSPGATSGNITCTWSTTDLDYQCTITGESFIYNKYVVNATVADINTVGIITANSTSNKIAVRIFKVDGTTRIQAPFYLVVFKP